MKESTHLSKTNLWNSWIISSGFGWKYL